MIERSIIGFGVRIGPRALIRDGVYFDVSRVPRYGELLGMVAVGTQATELIEVEKAPFLVGAIVGFEGIAMAEVGCKNDVIVSFFGQNFQWMTDHIESFADFAIFGIGGVVFGAVALYAWFRKLGYI